jgi:hypothetical protein
MFPFDGATRRRVYQGPGRFLAVNAAMRSGAFDALAQRRALCRER